MEDTIPPTNKYRIFKEAPGSRDDTYQVEESKSTMCCGGSDMEVLHTVYFLAKCCHLVEVCGKQGERLDLLGNVSGEGLELM